MSTKYRAAWHKGGFKYLRAEDAPVSKNEVKKMVNKAVKSSEEVKHYSYSLAEELTSTIQFTDLSAYITQGDGWNERIGDRMKMNSLKIRGYVAPKSTGTGDIARIMIIQWRPDNAADQPSNGELFEDISTVKEPVSGYTIEEAHRKKWKVLMDRTFLIPAYAQANSRKDLFFTANIKGKKMSPIIYEANGTTGSNHIYLVRVGTKTTGTTASNLYINMIQNYRE